MPDEQQAQSNVVMRLINIILAYIIPLLLLIAIIFAAIHVIQAIFFNLDQAQQLETRQEAYRATATAIAPAQQDARQYFRLVQFATNTPDAPVPTATPLTTATPAPRTPIAHPTFYNVPNAELETIAGTAVPSLAPVVPRQHELVNIVLLGSDGDIVGDNTIRTDTIVIVSINTETQTVALLNIPRDTFVYVPTPTMARINTVYNIGESFGWSGGGFGLLRETIFYNFGIQVHYHAFVDISGLVEIIDSVGGVNVAVDCAYQDPPLIDADVPAQAIGPDDNNVYILPVGYYHFTGREAMWYARSRGNSDAFDRGRRHIQLLEAIFRAGRDQGTINQIPELWNDLTTIVETDIPLDLVLGLLPIATTLDSSRIERFNLVRGYHTTPWTPTEGNYSGQNVQLLNQQPVFELLSAFYTPPPASRLSLASETIAVYNATDIDNLDIVASERLRAAGLNAIALGTTTDQRLAETTLIDYVAQARASALPLITQELNILSENVTVQPNPERQYDYVVTVGRNYNSCTGTVLPVE